MGRVTLTKRNDNRTLIDLEVQRRVTDALASAGVPQGRLSLEVLYMLPPAFVRGYVRLFDTALEESVRSGLGNADAGRRSVKRTGALRDTGKQRPGSPDKRRAVVQVGSGGGKRWIRRHWSIRNEDALKVKDSLDRKLLRLMDTTLRTLEETMRQAEDARPGNLNGGMGYEEIGDAGNDADDVTYTCFACRMDHTPLVRLLSRMRDLGADAPLRHCPRCGVDLG